MLLNKCTHTMFQLMRRSFSHQALGQVGKVLKVYADGDLRVAFGSQTWTFNPACICAHPVEVNANLMTTENPSQSGCKHGLGSTLPFVVWIISAPVLTSVAFTVFLFQQYHLHPFQKHANYSVVFFSRVVLQVFYEPRVLNGFLHHLVIVNFYVLFNAMFFYQNV